MRRATQASTINFLKALPSACALVLLPFASNAAAQKAIVELDEITVQAASRPLDMPVGTVGYVSSENMVGTKTKTPIVEVPQSISIVTRKQLDDQNVQTLKQALNYSAGVSSTTFGFDPRFDSFFIRGFDVTYTGVFRDGLRQGAGNFAIPKVEPYGLRDIAILRGPSSGLYGLGSPGGIVDLTTKTPTDKAFGELQLQGGSYDRYQGNFDLGGPVMGTDQLSYRLTGLVRDSGTFQKGFDDDRTYVAPAITWRPDQDTTLTLLAENLTSRTTADSSNFNGPNHNLTNIMSNDPAFGALDQEQARIGYAFSHRFSDLLTVRQNFRYYYVAADAKYTQIDSINYRRDIALRSTGRVTDTYNNVVLDNQAEFRYNYGPFKNVTLFGIDYSHSLLYDNIGSGTAPNLDLSTLNYGTQPIAAPAYSEFTKQVQDQVGVYLQQQTKLDRFVLTLNAREDWVDQNSKVNGVTTVRDNMALTGRVGLGYLFDSGIAPYISYANAFNPQLGINASGMTFAPTTGIQKEVGVKYRVPKANVLLTASLFDIKQNNVLRTDASNIAFQTATGQVESKGAEFEATASLRPGLNIIASYTHLDVKITRGDKDTTGNFFSGVPRNSVAGFATYTIQSGNRLAGLGFGGGIRYSGSNYGDDQNTFFNKASTLFDAVLSYDLVQLNRRFAGTRLQVNATNLFDRQVAACQSGYCLPGERRQIIGSLVYRW